MKQRKREHEARTLVQIGLESDDYSDEWFSDDTDEFFEENEEKLVPRRESPIDIRRWGQSSPEPDYYADDVNQSDEFDEHAEHTEHNTGDDSLHTPELPPHAAMDRESQFALPMSEFISAMSLLPVEEQRQLQAQRRSNPFPSQPTLPPFVPDPNEQT
ncbi:hypothetical protein PMAYCL1PPCAC_01379 [Pristionchus mayeri]|uniref:Uncharacterized protein n=1 Tax=Pristionchus mayeri TaxID=1317129 RepID=A0AAN4Z0J2_9BILA|nr:hypothetical protein PMAYCL1PPCAC_01379 [Pristionchus mayeri]